MKATSIKTTSLLKTLLLAGFIIFTVMSGMAQITRYRIGGGSALVTDGTKWSVSSGGTAIGGTITWNTNDVMIINSSSGASPGVVFPSLFEIASLQISGNKTVGISTTESTCTILLSGSSPINIATGSKLNLSSANITINITPATGTSTGIINGDIKTYSTSISGSKFIIGAGASITALGSVYGNSATAYFGEFSINGTYTTSSYVNSTPFYIGENGYFKTSYIGTAGWWNSSYPLNGELSGTIEFSANTINGIQIIPEILGKYRNIIISDVGKKIIPVDNYVKTNGNITINSGSILEISSTASLQVLSGTLTNNAGATGLVLKSDVNGTASLLHTTTGVDATVERYIGIDPYNWHFLSSPVIDQPIWPEFAPDPEENGGTWGEYDPDSPYNWDFYYFNPNALTTSELYWVNLRKPDGSYNNGQVMLSGSLAGYGSGTPSFFTGRGYLVAYGDGWSKALTDINIHTFTGTLNEGDITYDIVNSANAYNLIGNPYPSSIDWDLAEGLSSWTRSGAIAASGSGYDYYVWDEGVTGNYIYRNSASGLGDASNYISPGQGFFVKADANGGTLTFRDGIRVNTTESVFVKSTDVKNNYIRLKFTSSANSYYDEMFVEFNENYSGKEGSDKFWSFYAEAPELYSVKEGNNYSIDRYNTLTDDMKVDIAAKTGVAATYTITATNIADFTLRDKVYLLDLKTGIKTNLKQTPSYSFAGTPDDDRNRFQLIFGSSVGVEEETSGEITIYASGNTIYVRNDKASEPYTVMVSNMLGQVFTNKKFAGNTLNQITLNQTPGIYIVTVYSDGKWVSRKVVVE